jgi:hypothetical protein
MGIGSMCPRIRTGTRAHTMRATETAVRTLATAERCMDNGAGSDKGDGGGGGGDGDGGDAGGGGGGGGGWSTAKEHPTATASECAGHGHALQLHSGLIERP